MACETGGKTRYFYTGNPVGDCGYTGDFNFVSGGLLGQNISSGVLTPVFFPDKPSRRPWETGQYRLTQELLNASFPYINLKWIADIHIDSETIVRVSNRNIYVEDDDGLPRFYEARCSKSPKINITSGEWLSPNFEIGDLKLTLNNRDGYFNKYLAHGSEYIQWQGNRVVIKVGFSEKLLNYHTVFEGFVATKKGMITTDNEVQIHAYDKFDQDEVPIPARAYDVINTPNVERSGKGKPIPLIYGDWSTEVGDYGFIPAICVNESEPSVEVFVWQICDNALQEIGDVYLHRGTRVEDDEGPIKLIDGTFIKDLDNGQIQINRNAVTLSEAYPILRDKKAALGSGLNLIISPSVDLNFVEKSIEPGNFVFKEGVSTPATVLTVLPGQLSLSGGLTFTENDNFSILTDKFFFINGDKLSISCKGKDITTMSRFRISDAQAGITPTGISVTLTNSFWTVDNETQKIYEISFDGEVLNDVDYSSISASITNINGISHQSDGTLWIFDVVSSTIYSYIVDGSSVGTSFSTNGVFGLGVLLTSGAGLTINDGNVITIVDNFNGNFYIINPFTGIGPTLTGTFNISAFDINATEIIDISSDVNNNELLIVDRQTNKIYRIDPDVGTLNSSFEIDPNIEENFVNPFGISSSQDATIFVLNRSNNTIYNYNEFLDANDNPGFIARDILQSFSGKTSFDFDLVWNETSRQELSQYKARLYINKKTNAVEFIVKFLQQYNTMIYNRFQKYAIFAIDFDNFRTDGDRIRPGDIKLNSFKPNKEHNQYFNSAQSTYRNNYFSEEDIGSDVYISPLGIQLSGKEINKDLEMPTVYRREDVDKLMPLFVRLAASEPEFVDVNLGMRFLFTQVADFFSINFFDIDCITGLTQTGRRFDNIPCFVRKIVIDLDTLDFQVKLWSLGTTRFGNYLPGGITAGGEFDQIVLTNLGTPGYISPQGYIIASGANFINLEDVSGDNAETRTDSVVGNAWNPDYKVALIDASDHSIVEILTIASVSGDQVNFTENIVTSVVNTVKSSAGFSTSGHYLRYANYDEVTAAQKTFFAYFGTPEEGYPESPTVEIEEQRAGKHDFFDGRVPYLLHPIGFISS
jgi:hypothetical protein